MHSRFRPSPAMVVALIALFVALGGSAAALSGSNTVFTDDIANDTQPASGGNPAGGLVAADLRPSSVGSSEVAADSLGAGDLAPGSVASGEVADGAVGTAEHSSSIPAVKVYSTTSQSIPNNTQTPLNFNAEPYDTAAMHDNATNNQRLTAPVAGIYEVSAHLRWSSSFTGINILVINKYPGGAILAEDRSESTTGRDLGVTTPVMLAQGGYVTASAFHFSGTSQSIVAGSERTPAFSMTWLAPGP